MFINVRLLNGFKENLLYSVPSDWQVQPVIGSIVRVPLRAHTTQAVVTNVYTQKPADISFTIKAAHSLETFPADTQYVPFIEQLAQYYQLESLYFLKRIRQFLQQDEKSRLRVVTENVQQEHESSRSIALTDEQQQVADFLVTHIQKPVYTPTVLHGVTGSGKTEVYKRIIEHAVHCGKSVLLLLPEVTLAVAFAHRLRKELPLSIALHSFHSASTAKEKKLLWKSLLASEPIVIIGVHLPVFLPIPNLGLIIVDEEHEVGYQEKKHPKINSKDAAIWRAQQYNIPILLGSATPSLQTLYNVKTKSWHFYQLKKRFGGSFPVVKTVLLSDKKQRKNFWISDVLYAAIADRLAKKEQTIIFLNRRGYSFFVQCKACSFIFLCPTCSVSLTLHDNQMLTCHYCSYAISQPCVCPQCKANESEFLKKGIGTQQVVTILQKMFPHAVIARADMDTTSKKKQWQTTVDQMYAGDIDILVGTQTITKGYDFPHVTLVGVLWADLNLNFPVFNAAEIALQQLIQVAGRAGRQVADSLVVVQSMQNHEIFAYLNETDYLSYFADAMKMRSLVGYPPCKRLVEIELKYGCEVTIERESHLLANELMQIKAQKKLDIQILGPAKPPVHRIQNVYSRKIYLKSDSMNQIIVLFQTMSSKRYLCSLFFTPNPVS
jgi:primosomal protein N' (replication factor Y)